MSDLSDRVTNEILECQRHCTYVKDGYDKNYNLTHYCTYYFPESKRNDFECLFKGGLVYISKHFFVTNTYYKCLNPKARGTPNGQKSSKKKR